MRNRLRTANSYHSEIPASTHFDAEWKGEGTRPSDEEQLGIIPISLQRGLFPPAVECVQLAFQLFQLLSGIAQFSLCRQALIVFEVSGSTLDERVEIV
jgi:hypothetical protein